MNVDRTESREDSESLEAEANDLIHLFFDAELKENGKPVKREDVISQILPGKHRLFNRLVSIAQKKLHDEFGMQISQLPVLSPVELSGMSASLKKAISRKAG